MVLVLLAGAALTCRCCTKMQQLFFFSKSMTTCLDNGLSLKQKERPYFGMTLKSYCKLLSEGFLKGCGLELLHSKQKTN